MLHLESPALPGIVAALDVIKDIRSGLRSRSVVLAIHAFSFQDAEEALRGRVIGTTAHRTHATGHLMRRQEPLVFFRGKLAAPIRVQNHWRGGGALPQRHEHGLDHQLTVLTRTHRPPHDQPRIQIHHDAQVQPVFGGPNVGDVGHPFGIGGDGREVPRQMILRTSRPDSRALRTPPPSLWYALEPRPAHQARDPVAATALPGVAKVLPDPVAPHDAVLVGMELPNLCQ